jgi:hypothetical protein
LNNPDLIEGSDLTRRGTAWGFTAGKLVVSAAFFVYVARGIDADVFSGLAASLQGHVAIIVLGLFLGVFILGAVRWRRLTAVAGSGTGFTDALSLTWIGHFFNQLLPTSIGGDAVRAWYARTANMDLMQAAATVLCDRVIGVCALALLIALLFPASWHTTEGSVRVQVLAIALGCLFGAATFVAAARLFARYRGLRLLESCARLLVDVLRDRRAVALLLGSTLLAHVLTGLTGYVLIGAFWPEAPAVKCASLFLTALLVSMVPISYAGWGLREATVVYFLRDAGVSPDLAFKASVMYGVLLAVASLPGALFWAARTRPAPSER